MPQALFAVPGRHVLFWQQPLQPRPQGPPLPEPPVPLDPPVPVPPPAPVPPPVDVEPQLPVGHVEPLVQAMHTSPLLPHWVAVVAVTQVAPLQQPLQFAGPQVVALTQPPAKHEVPDGQLRHAPASVPQARSAVPG
jgi:hypothetical protein